MFFLQNLSFHLERKECNDKENIIKEQLKSLFEERSKESQIKETEKSKESQVEEKKKKFEDKKYTFIM
jgi:hypothetical protein